MRGQAITKGHTLLSPSSLTADNQVVEHRLPSDFDYHRVPAPWLQMKLVRILSLVGKGDKSSSEGMYAILADTIKRADTGINAGEPPSEPSRSEDPEQACLWMHLDMNADTYIRHVPAENGLSRF